MSITNQVITTNGVIENKETVNFVQHGKGSPVILTHGLAASLHDWDDLLPELSASGFAGYALDLFGHGESVKPVDHNEYTFESVFDHFSAWIDSLQINEPMILVGHSLGGGLCLQYTLRFPERVRALVLVNPFYDVEQLPPVMQFVYRNQLLNTGLIHHTPYRLFRIFVDISSTNFNIGQRELHVLPDHIRHQTALDFSRASSGIYNIPYTLPSLTSDLRRIQQPTLLVWGKRDQTLAAESFPRIGELLPNVLASHTLPICGHVPHQCHPDEFNPHVMKFLRNLPS